MSHLKSLSSGILRINLKALPSTSYTKGRDVKDFNDHLLNLHFTMRHLSEHNASPPPRVCLQTWDQWCVSQISTVSSWSNVNSSGWPTPTKLILSQNGNESAYSTCPDTLFTVSAVERVMELYFKLMSLYVATMSFLVATSMSFLSSLRAATPMSPVRTFLSFGFDQTLASPFTSLHHAHILASL